RRWQAGRQQRARRRQGRRTPQAPHRRARLRGARRDDPLRRDPASLDRAQENRLSPGSQGSKGRRAHRHPEPLLMRTVIAIFPLALALATSATADAAPRKKPPKEDKSPEQKEADRHFKSGVALFKEQKYAEALAEFERAYEIAPHPLVLYNIAGCHRELSHYADAVKFYGRFLAEGKGKVPGARLTAAQTELDAILARIARVTVTFSPSDGATLILDGPRLGSLLDMPLILPPGEHKFLARAPGRKDVERTLRLASGDEVTIELTLPELPPEKPAVSQPIAVIVPAPATPRRY